ncbi:MAG: hypothetical protein DMD95_20480 [Candidatus Rokuibacteriota bacterium]|nr:MAG: hypothetical protein DMD95_20480 [Candidatus Rokubacteria bacterium]
MPSVLRRIIGLVIGLAGVAIAVAPVAAQEPVAEVRTWSGETLRLSQPSLEVFYTIPVKGEDTPPADAAASTPPPMLFGSASSLAGALEKKPEPLSGQRQAESVTFQKGAVERRIPLLSVASLAFTRRPVVSALPAYLAATHFRYAATAVLLDGTTAEADYVNLGTTVLRGTASDGRIEIPWHEIETLRFVR